MKYSIKLGDKLITNRNVFNKMVQVVRNPNDIWSHPDPAAAEKHCKRLNRWNKDNLKTLYVVVKE